MTLPARTLTSLRAKQWSNESESSPYRTIGEDEIRLLCIQPGLVGDILIGSLEYYDLNARTSTYTAISYPWGPPEDPHHLVVVDHIEFSIRDNAYSILTRLRRHDAVMKVWIDRLCINQDNKLEKGAQIKLMNSIYKQATRTIIWLGKTDSLSDQAVEYILSLKVDKVIPEFERGWQEQWRHQNKTFILDLLQDHPQKVLITNDMSRLFFAVYWSRVWVRSEAALGKDLRLLWGKHELSWSHVAVLAWLYRPRATFEWPDKYFNIPGLTYDKAEAGIEAILSINGYRLCKVPPSIRGFDSVAAASLFGQMVYTRSAQTTKAHDKLYALRGMSSDINEAKQGSRNDMSFLEPNYKLSWQEVYVNAAKHFFSESYSAYQVLQNAGMIHQGASSDLPSWVPDWRHTISVKMLESTNSWNAGGAYDKVRIRYSTMSRKQRIQMLSYKGYASIMPLCGQLPRDKCKSTQLELYLELKDKDTPPPELTCADPWCKDKLSKAECTYFESASRAAIILEIHCCMRDKIVYLARLSEWDKDVDLPRYRSDILSIDAENLAYLEEQLLDIADGLYITNEPLYEVYDWTLITSQDSESKPAPKNLVSSAREWRAWLADDGTEHLADRHPFQQAIETAFTFRDYRFAYTEAGYMCLVPPLTQLGDDVCILNGYSMPFVVRPTVQDWNILLGQCYVHGMMTSKSSELIEEFLIKYDDTEKVTIVKRPDGDIRANGLKMEAGNYLRIRGTLGHRWMKLI